MKKSIFLFAAVIAICCSSCGGFSSGKNNGEGATNDSLQIDTLAFYLHKLDSINNSGKLRHLTVYELGTIKLIEFQVIKIESESDTVEYINLRKDCGGEYYYDWENAVLLAEEVKYFVSAIETITANFERTVKNEERYIYFTKDDIRLLSSNATPGRNKWEAELSVDYHKKYSSIVISKDDLETLKSLLTKGEQTIKELRNK